MPAQTIFVKFLPASASNERLEEIFSEIGPVKQCFVVREKGTEKCRGFGFVTYSMEEDAQRAMKEIKDYEGQRLSLSVAKRKITDREKRKAATKEQPAPPTPPPPPPPANPNPNPNPNPKDNEQKSKGFRKTSLKSKLIIRNLSFKCSEDDLKQVFSKFGTVLESKIPLKPDGKMRGFAFVLFKNVCEASRALNAMNLKEIKGRQVAVDWAVPKDKFVATQQSSTTENKNTEETTAKQSDAESDSEEDEEETIQEAPGKKKAAAKTAVQKEEESQSEDEDDDEDDLKAKKKTPRKLLPSDVQEGRTIFIRNLSFDTEEEGLEEVLLRYGELNYIKIVVHPDTEHSKGCAFAQFKTKEAADKCIAAAEEEAASGGIRLDGRKLFVVAAVSREDAAKLKVDKVKVESGTRNLYLAREGLIRAGTKAAEGVPEADMIKRTRFEEIKRTKLQSINVFVSKNRLCIHNLPKSVDNKKLRALCLQGVKSSKGVRIPECRVMYDRKPEKGQAMGQSLGYGFVQFEEHEHALSTLRYLNNNPDIFGPNKRPIVEFSLEDSRKLKIKELQKQKNKEFLQKQKSQEGAKPQPNTSEGGNKAHSSSQQTKRQNALPQQPRKDRNYYGFQTKPEVEHVSLENGKKRKKVLTFPSHHGPKIRMRDKGKQKAPPPNKTRPGISRKESQKRQMEKPTQSRNQAKQAKKQFKRRDGDRFDSLVEQYKKKLMGNSDKNTNMKRNKWFNS
ncbi:RNA-binding protein 28 isoform X2 [Labrus mixtus]|uniref:RNA-binding protein 28 isoform X2 n=1 Tax=Labrus mixtus TaxID=508554 RepID=UPI0029C0B1E5|nr:RNA-binding protein 28 isoform X2 [Labrus mixtus]